MATVIKSLRVPKSRTLTVRGWTIGKAARFNRAELEEHRKRLLSDRQKLELENLRQEELRQLRAQIEILEKQKIAMENSIPEPQLYIGVSPLSRKPELFVSPPQSPEREQDILYPQAQLITLPPKSPDQPSELKSKSPKQAWGTNDAEESPSKEVEVLAVEYSPIPYMPTRQIASGSIQCRITLEIDYVDAVRDQTDVFVEELVDDLSRAAGISQRRVGVRSVDVEEAKENTMDNFAAVIVAMWIDPPGLSDELSALNAALSLMRQTKSRKSCLFTDSYHTFNLTSFESAQVSLYLRLKHGVKSSKNKLFKSPYKRLVREVEPKEPEQPKTSAYVPIITVPEPFKFQASKQLELRESIVQRKLREYKQDLKREEHMYRSKNFRAKPIPPSTMVPKYDNMVQEAKERREKLRDSLKNLNAFSESVRKQHHARSEDDNDITRLSSPKGPSQRLVDYISRYTVQQAERRRRDAEASRKQEEKMRCISGRRSVDIKEFKKLKGEGKLFNDTDRKQYVQKKARDYLTQSSMPPGMEARMIQRAMHKKEEHTKTREQERIQQLREKDCRKVRQVPDFSKLHAENEKALEKRAEQRKQKRLTKPKAFKLSERKRRPVPVWKGPKPFFARPYTPPAHKGDIQLTRSATLRIEASRNLLRKKKDEEIKLMKLIAKSEVAKNIPIKKDMKTSVRALVHTNGAVGKISQVHMQKRIEDAQRSMRETDLEYKTNIEVMKKKVRERPLLMERDKIKRDQRESRKKALISIKESLDQGGVKHIEKYFNWDELRDLGLEHWLDKPVIVPKRSRKKNNSPKAEKNKPDIKSAMKISRAKEPDIKSAMKISRAKEPDVKSAMKISRAKVSGTMENNSAESPLDVKTHEFKVISHFSNRKANSSVPAGVRVQSKDGKKNSAKFAGVEPVTANDDGDIDGQDWNDDSSNYSEV
ncbi:hypothetical protein AAMO2058_000697500 [Amorphochlora amoebiformis]